jgi:hypothetical protein
MQWFKPDEKTKKQKNQDAKGIWVSLAVKTIETIHLFRSGFIEEPTRSETKRWWRRMAYAIFVECWIYQHFKLEKKPPFFFFCGDVAADSDSEKRNFSDSLVMFGAGAD